MKSAAAAAALLGAFLIAAGPASARTKAQAELDGYRTAARIADAHLKTFDTLDFDVFSNQKWDRLKESLSLIHI